MATTFVNLIAKHKSSLIYDPANTINESGLPNNSNVFVAPKILSFSNMLTGTNMEVQGRVHSGDPFQALATLTGATASNQNHEFSVVWNFIRVVRVLGSQNCVVYAQA